MAEVCLNVADCVPLANVNAVRVGSYLVDGNATGIVLIVAFRENQLGGDGVLASVAWTGRGGRRW